MVAKTKRYAKKANHVKKVYTSTELYRGDLDATSYRAFPHLNMISVSLADTTQQENKTQIIVSLLESDDVFSLVVNKLRKGISKNDIPWSKWETWGQVTVSTRALGKRGNILNIYAKYQTGRNNGKTAWFTFRNVTTDPQVLAHVVGQEHINVFNDAIARLYERNIGKTPIDVAEYAFVPDEAVSPRILVEKSLSYGTMLAYPVLDHMDESIMKVNNNKRVPPILSPFLRENDMASFTMKAFGKKNYRKDLVKAISGAIDTLYIVDAMALKNLVPTDWLITYLKDASKNKKASERFEHRFGGNLELSHRHKQMRLLFSSLTLVQRRRLLKSLDGQKPYLVKDTAHMLSTLKTSYSMIFAPGQIEGRSWDEVHDFLTITIRNIRTPLEEITMVPLAEKIEKLKYDTNLSLILPKTNYELIDWGKSMNHCIGSYTREAVNGSDVFVGIMEDNKMIGNAQIRVKDKSLVQVFGYRNKRLDNKVLKSFSDKLVSEEIIDEESLKRAGGYRS